MLAEPRAYLCAASISLGCAGGERPCGGQQAGCYATVPAALRRRSHGTTAQSRGPSRTSHGDGYRVSESTSTNASGIGSGLHPDAVNCEWDLQPGSFTGREVGGWNKTPSENNVQAAQHPPYRGHRGVAAPPAAMQPPAATALRGLRPPGQTYPRRCETAILGASCPASVSHERPIASARRSVKLAWRHGSGNSILQPICSDLPTLPPPAFPGAPPPSTAQTPPASNHDRVRFRTPRYALSSMGLGHLAILPDAASPLERVGTGFAGEQLLEGGAPSICALWRGRVVRRVGVARWLLGEARGWIPLMLRAPVFTLLPSETRTRNGTMTVRGGRREAPSRA
ncbi:hypothetical protein BGZ61DRAFT_474343 [Ilyonectria robusta]|uniref:uncharacterized protein n=1 Tax=Ilyonectria robusta TaxID=1079257 RepID=UPI001E8D0BFE|nr:uncharacterized protein BGZ61DRAFT_474343 [Ilyonectria robusta]KAH8733682.1 hypothetical protein BGZ61DRAFT_474343 [Ilyonectria robusta]